MKLYKCLFVTGAVFTLLWIAGCAQVLYPLNLKSCSPVYGSWCGEGYPSNGNNPVPVDSWDKACRSHDICYKGAVGIKGKLRLCDQVFTNELRQLDDGKRPVPQEMRNAFSWFSKKHTGRHEPSNAWAALVFTQYTKGNRKQFSLWIPVQDIRWSTFANCDGSDGKPAQFCRTPAEIW